MPHIGNVMFHVPEKYRVCEGQLATSKKDGNNGCFIIPNPHSLIEDNLMIICSDESGWDHVSVSVKGISITECRERCPTWDEMKHVKDIFWDEEDLVVQLHPPQSEYINYHPYVLHLWRKSGTNDFCDTPNMIL